LLTVSEGAGFLREDIVGHLESRGIQTRMLFAGNLLKHPCFDTLEEKRDYRIAGRLRNTDTAMERTFWFGVYPGLNEDMMSYIIETIKEFCGS